MSIDREQLLAYRRRWEAVAQVEQAEWQAATIAERWQQLNALLCMAGALGLQSRENNPLVDPAYQRWNRLKSEYIAWNQETLP